MTFQPEPSSHIIVRIVALIAVRLRCLSRKDRVTNRKSSERPMTDTDDWMDRPHAGVENKELKEPERNFHTQ